MDTLHDLIGDLASLRAEKKRLDFDLKLVEKQIRQKEHDVMDMMDDQQITESRSAAGKVTLSESVYPHVEDWDAFYHWIWEHQYFHFLEKRPTALAYREALDRNMPVPGVLPFTKRKITFKET